MTEIVTREKLSTTATIVAGPVRADTAPVSRTSIDRSFELPAYLYVLTVAAYIGFVGVMAMAFLNPELILPMVIFVLFFVAAFGTPTLWVRMNPKNEQRSLSSSAFRSRGIQTQTGRLSAGAAVVQVLILPGLIFCWGVAIAVIVAFVR